MLTNLIKNFMSRGEARTFITYSLEHGTKDIEEQPDQIDSREGTAKVLGSIVSSAKVFHVGKNYDKRLKLISCEMSDGTNKPDMPDGTLVFSIFYLSKHSVTDEVGEEKINSEIGSTIALVAEDYEKLVLGDSSEELTYRLFAFWEAEQLKVLRILILGFGKNAKELAGKIKRFPEFGDDKDIYISHIQVGRNSLSYGPDLVVEIPDLMGDGWRTYKDGFQAVHSMSTTVSDFADWAVKEMAESSFSHVIDCTSETSSSKKLLLDLFHAASKEVKFILDSLKTYDIPNLEKYEVKYSDNVDATISILRDWYNGGETWEPVEFSEKALKEASDAWEAAQVEMRRLHVEKRTKDVEERGNIEAAKVLDGYIFLEGMIPPVDISTLYRFVVFGDPSGDYEKTVKRDAEKLCTVITHEMLDWFYGPHCAEGIATFVFCNPLLQVDFASYYRYESNDSKSMNDLDYEYALEYVVGGDLEVITPSGRKYSVPEGTAYCYMPKVNAPTKNVKMGTETLMFYYKEN